MSIKPFNSVDGFSTGLSGFPVVDAVGGISAAGATFSGSTLAFKGTNAKTILSTQAPLTIKGATSGASIGNYNAVVLGVQVSDPLQLYSASGVVDINSSIDAINPYSTGIRLNTSGGEFGAAPATVTVQPGTYFTANRTINIPDASGTLALTGANTFSGLQTMNAGLTANNLYVTNGATFAARASFNAGLSAANLFVSGGGTFGTAVSISGGTAWHANNDGKGSGLDTDLVHGISGQRFTENLQTGLLYGGLLSINAGLTSTFNLSAGSGIIVDPNCTTGSAPNPIITSVSWNAATGITLSGLTSQDLTYISINSSGNVVQSGTPFNDAAYESQIPLGALIHPTRSYISFAKNYPHVAYGQSAQFDPFIRAFGPLKLSGHEISGYDSTLQLSRSSGTSYALGRNYATDPKSPNIVTDTNANPASTIYRLYRNGSGGFTTVVNSAIDAGKYDDGTGTLATVAGGQYTIQRVFFFPNEPTVLAVYYGRAFYNSIDSAKAALFYEEFSETTDTADSAIFCAYLIVKSGISNFSLTNEYSFVQAGLFRSTANVGGGGATVALLDDLTDVTITSATNNQVLRYNNGTAQWVNSSVDSIYSPPLATTGSTGVASFNADDFTVGATGHVRIKTGINATNIVVLGSGGTGGVGKLPAVDGSDLLEVNAKYLNGKTNAQITDGGTF